MYEPRTPSQGVLYQVVRDPFETFRAQAAGLRDGEGLPRFVEQEFREFLRCGGRRMAERKTCRYWLAWRRRPGKGRLRWAPGRAGASPPTRGGFR